jgi:hypothetical protein
MPLALPLDQPTLDSLIPALYPLPSRTGLKLFRSVW